MVQTGDPGGWGTPAYIAPTERIPEESSVTSGASVNKYAPSTSTVVRPKLNQSVRPKKCGVCKLPGSSSEDWFRASCGVGFDSGLLFIETRLPTNRHRLSNNLYGWIEAKALRRIFNRAGLRRATERFWSTIDFDHSITAAFFLRSFNSFHVVRMMPRS